MIHNFLTPDDIGAWVLYAGRERGKIKRYDNDQQIAWVVYKCNENWDMDHWKDYTACATNYSDLERW